MLHLHTCNCYIYPFHPANSTQHLDWPPCTTSFHQIFEPNKCEAFPSHYYVGLWMKTSLPTAFREKVRTNNLRRCLELSTKTITILSLEFLLWILNSLQTLLICVIILANSSSYSQNQPRNIILMFNTYICIQSKKIRASLLRHYKDRHYNKETKYHYQ